MMHIIQKKKKKRQFTNSKISNICCSTFSLALWKCHQDTPFNLPINHFHGKSYLIEGKRWKLFLEISYGCVMKALLPVQISLFCDRSQAICISNSSSRLQKEERCHMVHRLVNGLSLKGPLQVTWSSSLAQERSPTSGGPESYAGGF